MIDIEGYKLEVYGGYHNFTPGITNFKSLLLYKTVDDNLIKYYRLNNSIIYIESALLAGFNLGDGYNERPFVNEIISFNERVNRDLEEKTLLEVFKYLPNHDLRQCYETILNDYMFKYD